MTMMRDLFVIVRRPRQVEAQTERTIECMLHGVWKSVRQGACPEGVHAFSAGVHVQFENVRCMGEVDQVSWQFTQS